MPDMNGVEVLEFIQSHKSNPNIDIILNTSLAEDDDRVLAAKAYNLQGRLRKSQDRNFILKTLKEAFQQIAVDYT
ncbi:MAG: hypothetical protein HRT88_22705 [Lentisphaeraceae bacterium]|nr:hypothetical protein [Lentisphaeraceae bacterium]